ncbi:MAG TPA: metalloregulator ArsR/SmtB family transcription factor [Thermodesulfobacteriota bacterium]|nr:metalloregulator ArsR/SmtB family transcription factor [Thermodesulfobacteriota bacterium]
MARSRRVSRSKRLSTASGRHARALAGQPLLPPVRAGQLAGLFKILANGSRLRLLHALAREGEMCVTALARTLGMTPQAVSNQLQRLVDRGVLGSTRKGNRVYYRILDPAVPHFLAWHLRRAFHPRRR